MSDDRERLIEALQECRRDDAALIDRYRAALREIAGHVEDGGEYPDSYELGCRDLARIASGALADAAKEDGR